MRRAVFNALWIVSLALVVGVGVFWVRSYRTITVMDDADSINFTREEPYWWIISNPGRATLCRQEGRDWDQHDLPGFDVLGLSFGGGRGPGSMLWNFSVPYWMLAIVFAVLPVVRLERWRRSRRDARRARGGRCVNCGYDLRATPERCPECGWVADARVSPEDAGVAGVVASGSLRDDASDG